MRVVYQRKGVKQAALRRPLETQALQFAVQSAPELRRQLWPDQEASSRTMVFFFSSSSLLDAEPGEPGASESLTEADKQHSPRLGSHDPVCEA